MTKNRFNAIVLLQLWLLPNFYVNIANCKNVFTSKKSYHIDVNKVVNKILLEKRIEKFRTNNSVDKLNYSLPSTNSKKRIEAGGNKTELPKNIVITPKPTVTLDVKNIRKSTPEIPENKEIVFEAGPSNPEFSTFESVSSDNMVDLYTGDLNYNLPLLEIPGAHDGGYAVSLSYHSGSSPIDDASWVGYGWSLNPGAINRMKKGLPDDLLKGDIEYINNMPDNKTYSIIPSIGLDFLDLESEKIAGISFSKKFRYNNYKGFGGGYSANLSLAGLSLGYNYEDGKGSFDASINPLTLFSRIVKSCDNSRQNNPSLNNQVVNEKAIANSERATKVSISSPSIGGSINLLHSFTESAMPITPAKYSGTATQFSLQLSTDFAPTLGAVFGLTGVKTIQKPESIVRKGVGYIYMDKADQSNAANDFDSDYSTIMDYHNEMDGSYNKRDQYLHVPFPDADIFGVSAEGLSGGFRAYWLKPALCGTPSQVNTTDIVNAGVQIKTGNMVGVGLNFKVGDSKIKVSPSWEEDGSYNDYKLSTAPLEASDEKLVFRFNNDLGGNVIYNNDFGILNTSLERVEPPSFGSFSLPDIMEVIDAIKTGPKYKANLSGNTIVKKDFSNKRLGRASYIEYHTNAEIRSLVSAANGINNPNLSLIHEYKTATTNPFIDRTSTDAVFENQIGEVAIYNQSGTKYVFGLPVYNRNEKSMEYNFTYSDLVSPSLATDEQLLLNINNSKFHVGQYHKYAYPTSYLLTSIRSSDYRDANANGLLDDADFGGYTSFDYRMAYGNVQKNTSSGNWFNWRSPYTGYNLNQNELWDRNDDMAGFSSGQKEVYYLKTIETKTHVAVFVTNNTTTNISVNGTQLPNTSYPVAVTRKDAKGSNANDFSAGSGAAGSQRIEYLRKVMLFAKPTGASTAYKLLKTVNFDYDYSAWPNSAGSDPNNGKLTLKKVWVESEYIKSDKVTPYEFVYTYPNLATVNNFPTKYQNVKDFYNNTKNDYVSSTAVYNASQMPDFISSKAMFVDRWGNYQKDGNIRNNKMIQYVNQVPHINFDPAAWQLKKVLTPTKAQVHIQYEQDDYRFVQDQTACVMTPLGIGETDEKLNEFKIDLSATYPNINTTQKIIYAKQIKAYFDNEKYLYYKFLYTLNNGSSGGSKTDLPLANDECRGQYISGYVKVNDVTWDANGNVTLKLGKGNTGAYNWFTTNIKYNFQNDVDKYILPRMVCVDYVLRETGLQAGFCDYESSPALNNGLANDDWESLVNKIRAALKNQFNMIFNGKRTLCAIINPQLSYFKLPVFSDADNPGKKGGGLRVKRIFTYDEGVITGTEKNMYGSEYYYQEKNGQTTGVASNEPKQGREENALVNYLLKRTPKSATEKIIAGKDIQQFEGPFGENLLPNASVGYSKVIVKNLHTGASDNGYSVTEYFTYKDCPTFVLKTNDDNFKKNDVSSHYSWLEVPLGIINWAYSKRWASQDFAFGVQNKAGMLKAQKQYRGTSNVNNYDAAGPIYTKEYEYYKPLEKIPVVKDVLTEPTMQYLGVETEMAMDRRSSTEETVNYGGQIDMQFGVVVIPLFVAMGLPYAEYSYNTTNTAVSNKITYFPTILKAIKESKDGIESNMDIYAYDQYNGTPVITSSKGDYTGLMLSGNSTSHSGVYYSYNQKGSFTYPELGQKAINDKLSYGLNATFNTSGTGEFYTTIASGVQDYLNLVVGDLVAINIGSGVYNMYVSNIVTITATDYSLTVQNYNTSASLPASFTSSSIKVLRSGRENDLSTHIGDITTYDKIQLPLTAIPQISSTVLAKRQKFVDYMNNILACPLSSNFGLIYGYPNIEFSGCGAFYPDHINNKHGNSPLTSDAPLVKGGQGICAQCCSNPGYVSCRWTHAFMHDKTTNKLYATYFIWSGDNTIYSLFPGTYTPPNYSSEPIAMQNFFNTVFTTTLPSPCNGVGLGPGNKYGLMINYQNLGNPGGSFSLNSLGQVEYTAPGQATTVVNMYDFCDDGPQLYKIPGVITNGAVTLRDDWNYNGLKSYANTSSSYNNSFDKNVFGNLRVNETFVYKTNRRSANKPAPDDKVYNAGTYDLIFGGWFAPNVSAEWVRTNEVIAYSPHGEPIQERDALNVVSSSAYGFKNTLPNYVGVNAVHNSMLFESFEELGAISNYTFTGVSTIGTVAHAGKNCVAINPGTSNGIDFSLEYSSQNGKSLLRFWATTSPEPANNIASPPTPANINTLNVACTINGCGTSNLTAKKISSAGVWSLYEAEYVASSIVCALPNANIKFSIKGIAGSVLYLDDVRIQPANSKMTAYVYEPGTKKLLTSFDDSHFGEYYLYNAEGKLVRKLIETESGLKMVEEKQYNSANKSTRIIN